MYEFALTYIDPCDIYVIYIMTMFFTVYIKLNMSSYVGLCNPFTLHCLGVMV